MMVSNSMGTPEDANVVSQDTAASADGASGQPFLERKLKSDGSVREYPCTLALRRPGLVAVRYVLEFSGAFNTPVPLPRGTVSDGYFWTGRPVNLYRMRSPEGQVLAHRFDAVDAVEIGEGVVTYRDLDLDWWVLPGDVLLEEDRAEFDAHVAAGTLDRRQVARAEAASREVHSRYRHVIDEAVRLESALPPLS
jgi:hypothetical protein